MLATDAANKAYVDAAVTVSGSGSFVSKAGDTMTGPLQLPSDPTAPDQASTKHYVDSGLAVKADVIGGVVPTAELGNGTANNGLCLHGDSSWGACGSSSNAVSIQNVPVDTVAPTDNQVITYVASSGKYVPRASNGATAGMSAVKYSPDFNWSQSPAANLTVAGAKTVSLTVCPPGVIASEVAYNVYVAGTGTAEVQYRGPGRGIARVTNPASIAAQQSGDDDGVRGSVREVQAPSPRTSADCEHAALALLDDAGTAWSGTYETWSDFLPGGADDIFPGDALNISVSSRNAIFQAIVREVAIEIRSLKEEHSFYKIQFADDVAAPLAFQFQSGDVALPLSLTSMTTSQVGTVFLPCLTAAEITAATSTSVNVDAGVEPGAGGGIEVRWSDFGWGVDNDRNLAGRFSTRTFNLARLAAVQNYFLRQFDSSTPPKYSRYTTALHLKYPL